jgi:hypothetical protein
LEGSSDHRLRDTSLDSIMSRIPDPFLTVGYYPANTTRNLIDPASSIQTSEKLVMDKSRLRH